MQHKHMLASTIAPASTIVLKAMASASSQHGEASSSQACEGNFPETHSGQSDSSHVSDGVASNDGPNHPKESEANESGTSLSPHIKAELASDDEDELAPHQAQPFEYLTPPHGTTHGLNSQDASHAASQDASQAASSKAASGGFPSPPEPRFMDSSEEEPLHGPDDTCEKCKKYRRLIGRYKQMLHKINHAMLDGVEWYK